jgi:uncharacterized membrane protein (UPF0127 family)
MSENEIFVKRWSFASVVLFASIALALDACSAPGAGKPGPTSVPPDTPEGAGSAASIISARGFPLGDLQISSEQRAILRLEVEIADTPEASARGLMNVEHLRDEQGMVFLSSQASTVPFWMKDTLIPLDIAFWDRDGRIFDIQQMQPCTVPGGELAETVCRRYPPSGPYVGALEVNLGLLERTGVTTGAVVELERR